MQVRNYPMLSLFRMGAVCAALFVALVVSACAPMTQPGAAPDAAGDTAETGPARGGTLTMSLGDDFVTFHPYFDVGYQNSFKPIFFEAPIRISDEGDFEPWLAESYELSEDKLSVTLHLRDGVMFHNGREMTAEDVVWSVDHARNADLGHHLSDRFSTAAGAEVIDENTVRINYSEPSASILDGVARMYIFPEEAAETIETIPVGTGPFQFVEWIPGDSMTAERFEDYWQEGLPYLDRVIIRPLPDPQSRLVNLQAGSIEVLMGVPLADKASLEGEEGIVVDQIPAGFAFYAFIINVNAPPFDDVRVRQAMQYAVDRQRIADLAFHGEATPVLIPYAPTSWAYPEGLDDYYTHDPERARELLAEAGYPDGFSIQLLVRGAEGQHLDQAQVFQQDLAEIGVQAELLPTELPQYWPLLFESEFSIVSHATGDTTVDPSGLFEGAACCRPFRNFFGIVDSGPWFDEYQDIIFQARAATDRDERAALYRQALEIFLEQAWTIPTVWDQDTYAYRTYVQDFRVDMDGLFWLGETWLDN